MRRKIKYRYFELIEGCCHQVTSVLQTADIQNYYSDHPDNCLLGEITKSQFEDYTQRNAKWKTPLNEEKDWLRLKITATLIPYEQ